MPTPAKSGSKPAKAATTSAAAKPAAEKPKKAAAAPKAATVKSAAKPAAAKPAAPKKAPAAKKATAPAAAKATMADLSDDQRRYYIEVAAYYIAERRGFHGGSELDDWVQAEAEVARLVQEGVLKP